MSNLLESSEPGCRRTQDGLEAVASRRPRPSSAEELIEELPGAERAHAQACSQCREAAEDLLATRQLFGGVASFGRVDRPFFPARVMAAIAARERELAELVSPWSEVPRFAARLAWIAAALLLVGTTLLYEKVPRGSNGDASQESIFEAPQPTASPDDVLISMERNP